jgi:heat shock protein HslJ
MRRTFLGVAAICAGALMASCMSSKKAAQTVDLTGEWNIVTVDGEKLGNENMPFIGLDTETKRVYGSAGCNRMMGGFELDSVNAGKIHFSQIATTRMMCPDMDTEQKILGALNKVEGYSETETGIELTDAEGKTVIVLEKRVQAAVSINDLAGEWIISAVSGEAVKKMEKTPFLAFNIEEKRVHGNAGCNIINGGFSQEEGNAASLKFSQMISTMMACPDMDVETQVLKALNEVASFEKNEDGSVSLLDGNGKVLLTLVKNTGESLVK